MTLQRKTTSMLRNDTQTDGHGRVLWDDLSNGKRTREWELSESGVHKGQVKKSIGKREAGGR
jgi:hypothetical protein